MGGYGSGSWYRWNSKTTTESRDKIDIRWLKKKGYLRPGATGILSFIYNDKEIGYREFVMEKDRMILQYHYLPHDGEWKSDWQIISFDRTPCNYGGYRMWFLCPRCRKRVAILYEYIRYPPCRRCCKLNYSSQHEGRPDRLRRKARKIRARLGASSNLTERFFFKPKNMHQKTFDRLRKEAEYASDLSVMIMRYGPDVNF